MVTPSIVFAFVLASVYGLAFYLIFGHGWARLGLYWVSGVLGFFLGNWLASLLGLSLLTVGTVNPIEATVLSWASLFVARAWHRI